MVEMKKHRAILIIFIGIAVAVFAVTFLASSLITHIFLHSKKEIVRRPEDIENALLVLKNQKQDFNAPHLVFEISRKPYSAWNWFFNWKSASISHAWTQGDRIIEFVNVGGMLVYSVPIRWRENNSARPVISETETNVSPPLFGTEIYSTSDEEYKCLDDFLTAKTSNVELRCSISKDATGRMTKDIEYLDGTLSLPQNEWAGFVQSLFKQVYNSNQPIYVEQIELRPWFGL
jgi:hypothetical protein